MGHKMMTEKQVCIRDRILRWGPNGIGYESDQIHAAILVKKNLTSKDRPVSTPGEDMNGNVNKTESSAPEEIKSFRADGARGNCMSMDRPKLQFSAKENLPSHDKINEEEGSAQNRKTVEVLEGSGNNSRSRSWTPPSQRTQTQIGQVCRSSRNSTSGAVVSTNT